MSCLLAAIGDELDFTLVHLAIWGKFLLDEHEGSEDFHTLLSGKFIWMYIVPNLVV